MNDNNAKMTNEMDSKREEQRRMGLEPWGWDEGRACELATLADGDAGLLAGRVIRQERGLWTLATAAPASECERPRRSRGEEQSGLFAPIQERPAQLGGRARRDEASPVVGDWVCWRDHGDTALIEGILGRRTEISRKASGTTTRQQVMAANVDILFLVQGLGPGRGFTTRGLERYLAMAWDSGCEPVVVLNKADLSVDAEAERLDAEAVSGGAEVLLCAALPETEGAPQGQLDELMGVLGPGITAAFVGPSGVGKSSLINALAGTEVAATGAVREADRRGRHTTTQRQLHRLPDGALLLDTPGLRELALWGDEDAADAVFPEIEELLGQCRYRDCRHDREPGCAIREALETGEIEAERFDSWLELREELANLGSRREVQARRDEKLIDISKTIRRMKKGQAVW